MSIVPKFYDNMLSDIGSYLAEYAVDTKITWLFSELIIVELKKLRPPYYSSIPKIDEVYENILSNINKSNKVREFLSSNSVTETVGIDMLDIVSAQITECQENVKIYTYKDTVLKEIATMMLDKRLDICLEATKGYLECLKIAKINFEFYIMYNKQNCVPSGVFKEIVDSAKLKTLTFLENSYPNIKITKSIEFALAYSNGIDDYSDMMKDL